MGLTYPERLKIVYWPNSVLNIPSQDVTSPVPEAFLQGMVDVMKSNFGVGLSAVQVGVHEKIIVTSAHPDKVFINAKITEHSKEREVYPEGCLSIPGFMEMVSRWAWVDVSYQDRDLQPKTLRAEGILSQVLQHEIEHTEGKMFVSHLKPSVRSTILGIMMRNKRLGKLK